MNRLRTRLSLIVGLVVTLELVGRARLVAGNRRGVPDRTGHEAADAVAERGDVLTRKSWPAALGGASTEHAEEIDHPRLLAFGVVLRVVRREIRAICRASLTDSLTQHG
jgi:hypothetical protein